MEVLKIQISVFMDGDYVFMLIVELRVAVRMHLGEGMSVRFRLG